MLEFQTLVNKIYSSLNLNALDAATIDKCKKVIVDSKNLLIPFSFPLGVQFEITSKCNLKCRHCYNDSLPGKGNNDLTEAEWLKIAETVSKNGALTVTISGGEPLLKETLVRKMLAIFEHNPNMTVGIITNGWLVTEDFVNFYSKIKNNKWVQVSIDGAYPHEHDWVRNKKGSWERAVRAAELFIQASIPTRIAHTCHRGNYKDLWKMAELSVLLGASSFVYTPILNAGRAYHERENLILTKDELQEYKMISAEIKQKYSDYLKISEGVQFKDYFSRFAILPAMGALIRPEGNLKIDCAIPVVFGNLRQESFENIWLQRASLGWQNPVVIDYIKKVEAGDEYSVPYVMDDIMCG
ncbi:radical SAM protein [Anaerobranca gottschalkii]|uniref:Radical SAM superfamily enzyme, MoaA/NifB/PqqE/SkfB family n=1 Tax=Anaerobranca gottschalkii DSM 13577 TaxID=1120990 RepID=A0A1I0CC06_9FIRM|nr:radical SAM protein [Anaerobranca gottschalkii]SET17084.1 Radical SAM superfamily enzyme, MoaA/NifB/PqqE/SkfB family [Anaerobranca gottschalkii DSM 13577]